MSLFHHRLLMAKALEMANPYLPWDTPKAIKDAMVLYYDIAKQKATNESMAENPTLKDLSGNGNDATCYNFGWSGMSGIGGYTLANLEKWIKNTIVQTDIITPNKIKITEGSSGTIGIRTSYSANINIKFRFSEILTPVSIYQNQGNIASTLIQTINKAGEYVINLEYNPNASYNQVLISGLCTIEQLPQYPNALVSDGVDDYAFVQDKYDDEGNLINKKSLVLNREDGYTVIAKRKWINEPTSGSFNPLASKASSNLTIEPNAFIFEWNRIADEARNYGCWSFGASTNLNSITNEDIVYQTSKSYNGTNRLTIGNNEDSDRLYLCSQINNTGFSKIALYSFILFNRDLADEEIGWVRAHMVEGRS